MSAMEYMEDMSTTVRNLDEGAYRAIKSRAALEGKNVGEMISEAIRAYVASPPPTARTRSLTDVSPRRLPRGTERLSEKIDDLLYGSGSRR